MQSFINSLIDTISNGNRTNSCNSRSAKECIGGCSPTSTESKDSRGTHGGIEKEPIGISWRNIKSNNSRRYLSPLRGFRFKGKQCTADTRNYKESRFKEKAKQVIFFLPLYFFYNPQFLFTLIYIDTMFMDELISINIIQINRMYEILTDKSLIYNGGIG